MKRPHVVQLVAYGGLLKIRYNTGGVSIAGRQGDGRPSVAMIRGS